MQRRIAGAAVALLAFALLGVAWMLDPAAEGVGTHTQLGLPTCGWVLSFGTPCPTCGMTTSFALAADGRIGSAVYTQPAGALLAIATAVAGLAGLHVAITGAATHQLLSRLWRGWMWWALLAIILAAWFWKIAVVRGAFA